MAKIEGKDDMEKLKVLNNKPYAEQAQWFMNAYWKTMFEKNDALRLKIFESCQNMIQLDGQKGKAGCELNEFDAHRFLEKTETALTVVEMRKLLTTIDLDFNKRMSLTEFLVVHYKQDWHFLVNAKMGENAAEIEKAQALLNDAQMKLHLALKSAEDANKAEKDQLAAESELKRALAALEAEELAYKEACEKLEAASTDMSKGIVTRNKAANELAQLKAKDPMPLQRAKINQAAAVRKAEKATVVAQEKAAVAAAALQAAEKAFDDAQTYLDEVSKNVGSAEGSLWWMSHELEEAKKYLPQSKGGKAKK